MRRWGIVGLAGGLVALGVATPSLAGPSGSGDQGTYLTPFREDRASYVNGAFANGSYVGQPTSNAGCVEGPTANSPQGNPLAYRCMPAGASVVQLYDGR